MSIFVNKRAKGLIIFLGLVLLLEAALIQIIAYANAVWFKNLMIEHDYEIAGYLSHRHPELAYEIQEAFAADKTLEQLKTGKALLEQSGYKDSIGLYLMPQVNRFYRGNMLIGIALSILPSLVVLLATYRYLKGHYEDIDRYSTGIMGIMDGKIPIRLEDKGEGSLAKLAASVNMVTASLHAHVEREKQNRIFLKDVLTNVSHQLKTPLSALAMYAEIMRGEEPESEVINEFLDKSENELKRMQNLIVNLLKLAKLDAGIIELNKSNHVLNDIIERAVESFETRMSRERKTFEVNAKGEVIYPCDREWMLEALGNLIKNAVEHTTEGDSIGVSIEETPLLIRITVEDNGEGIHPDDINHIFKRFYRSKFSQDKQGTGVGLTLAKTIIEMHGGFISVESIWGKGTKFTIHLPNLQNRKAEFMLE